MDVTKDEAIKCEGGWCINMLSVETMETFCMPLHFFLADGI